MKITARSHRIDCLPAAAPAAGSIVVLAKSLGRDDAANLIDSDAAEGHPTHSVNRQRRYDAIDYLA
jgi:hypothetical protein